MVAETYRSFGTDIEWSTKRSIENTRFKSLISLGPLWWISFTFHVALHLALALFRGVRLEKYVELALDGSSAQGAKI